MSKTDLINDEVKLIRHRLIARRLAEDPAILTRAIEQLNAAALTDGPLDHIAEWKAVLSCDIDEIRRRLVARDEDSYRLRLSSPFVLASGLPLSDERMRRRIWQIGRRLVERRLSMGRGNQWLEQLSGHRRTLTA